MAQFRKKLKNIKNDKVLADWKIFWERNDDGVWRQRQPHMAYDEDGNLICRNLDEIWQLPVIQ